MTALSVDMSKVAWLRSSREGAGTRRGGGEANARGGSESVRDSAHRRRHRTNPGGSRS